MKPKKSKKSKNIKPKEKKEFDKKIEELNKAFLTFRFYPVAVGEDKKEEAKKKIIEYYKKGTDPLKQTILYLCYETLTQYIPSPHPYNFTFYKTRFPKDEPGKTRMNVYRSMFNFNSSLEGVQELIQLISSLNDTGSVKLLTHLFSYFTSIEAESARTLRNAVIDALGESDSLYAFNSLTNYAKIVDSERIHQRILHALASWEEKLNSLNLSSAEKKNMKDLLEEIFSMGNGDVDDSDYVR